MPQRIGLNSKMRGFDEKQMGVNSKKESKQLKKLLK